MKLTFSRKKALATAGIFMALTFGWFPSVAAYAAELRAGAAKVDITSPTVPLVNDPLYVKALVLDDGANRMVIITVDAVAIGGIGPIKNDYLSQVRAQLEKELNIRPANVLINASHTHGVVCEDVGKRTIQAVKAAARNLVPVKVGAGVGRENRIMENRRLKLKSGKEADVRHAYSLPPDEEVVGVGPVDPQIGILRLDRENGQTMAVVYNFACHPIQGVPNGGSTADITGFASQVLEDNLSEGTVALFLQGCGGDVNPITYKDAGHPRDAEPLGNMLGLSTLQALRKIASRSGGEFKVINETIALPRANHAPRIATLQAEQAKLLQSLRGTTLNLKTFIPMVVRYKLSGDYPSYDSHRYLHAQEMGTTDLERLDALNRKNLAAYLKNVYTMEELTRIQENLFLLTKHQAKNEAAGMKPIEVEVVGVRIGDFVLVTFPGELTVPIGLNIKKTSPHPFTFVSGYTNGYIYYTPTAEQMRNEGGAQEDSDCLLAPEWQKQFEDKVREILQKL